MKFLKNVISELKMISWLPKTELLKTSGLVLMLTLIITCFVFGIDSLVSGIYGIIMKSI